MFTPVKNVFFLSLRIDFFASASFCWFFSVCIQPISYDLAGSENEPREVILWGKLL